jgi:hypothetical protein
MNLYIHSPICLHGIVLNYLSTGTFLPFTHGMYTVLPNWIQFATVGKSLICFYLQKQLPDDAH